MAGRDEISLNIILHDEVLVNLRTCEATGNPSYERLRALDCLQAHAIFIVYAVDNRNTFINAINIVRLNVLVCSA